MHTVLKAPRYVNYLNRKRATLVVAVFDWFRCCGTGVVVVVFELRTSLVSLASTIVKQTTKQLALHLLLICLFLIYESDFQHCLHCFLCSPFSLCCCSFLHTFTHLHCICVICIHLFALRLNASLAKNDDWPTTHTKQTFNQLMINDSTALTLCCLHSACEHDGVSEITEAPQLFELLMPLSPSPHVREGFLFVCVCASVGVRKRHAKRAAALGKRRSCSCLHLCGRQRESLSVLVGKVLVV